MRFSYRSCESNSLFLSKLYEFDKGENNGKIPIDSTLEGKWNDPFNGTVSDKAVQRQAGKILRYYTSQPEILIKLLRFYEDKYYFKNLSPDDVTYSLNRLAFSISELVDLRALPQLVDLRALPQLVDLRALSQLVDARAEDLSKQDITIQKAKKTFATFIELCIRYKLKLSDADLKKILTTCIKRDTYTLKVFLSFLPSPFTMKSQLIDGHMQKHIKWWDKECGDQKRKAIFDRFLETSHTLKVLNSSSVKK